MKHRTEILADGVELHLGDCCEIEPALGVDHYIFDPPYEDIMHRAKKLRSRRIRTDSYQDPKPVDFESIEHLRPIITPLLTKNCSGWLLAFCTPEGVAAWRDAIEAANGRYKRACIWHKPNAAPQFNGQGPGTGAEMFVTAWCGEGYSRWNGGGRSNVFRHPLVDPETKHPTEKPLTLMLELITLFTNPGELIGDPFMGSGTTGAAAVRLGRRFRGIEKKLSYFDMACRRIDRELRTPGFIIPKPEPKRRAGFFK